MTYPSIRLVTFLCITWRIRLCGMTYSFVGHDSLIYGHVLFICMIRYLICEISLIHLLDITHLSVWFDLWIWHRWMRVMSHHIWDITYSFAWYHPFICVIWRIDLWDMTHWSMGLDSFISVTWLVNLCDVTYWSVRHDPFICVTWLIDLRHMTLWSVTHDWSIYVTWLIHLWDMTNLSVWHYSCSSDLQHDSFIVWHDSFICVIWLILLRWIYLCDVTLIHACMTNSSA